jgi:hypothetical protein
MWSGNQKFYIEFSRLLRLQSFIITLYVLIRNKLSISGESVTNSPRIFYHLYTPCHFLVIFQSSRLYTDRHKKRLIMISLINDLEIIFVLIFLYYSYTGCIMKNLWCYNFLIFYPILINDMSNKIVSTI